MRRQSRELAMQVLFQSEFAPQISISTFLEIYEGAIDTETITFAEALIQGVKQHKAEIDQKIQNSSRHWKIERMATIDRNILRVAAYEMFFSSAQLSGKIVINEAVEIAKKYGTTDSAGFINGLLDQMYQPLK